MEKQRKSFASHKGDGGLIAAVKFEGILQAITDAIVYYNAGGLPVFANRAAVALLGFDPVAEENKSRYDSLTARRPGGPSLNFSTLMPQEVLRGETVENERYIFPDSRGQSIMALASWSPVMEGARVTGAVLVLRSASLYEEIYDKLEKEKSRFETVLQNLPVGVTIAAAPDSRVLIANKKNEEIWKEPAADTPEPAYAAYKGFHKDGKPVKSGEWPLARVIREGEAVLNEEIDIVRRDGTTGTLLINAAPIHDAAGRVTEGVAITLDITGRVQAEYEIADRAAELEAVFTAQNDAVLIYDTGMNVKKVNPAFREAYGFDPMGLNVKDIIRRVSCRTLDGKPLVLKEQPTPRALRGETVTGARFLVTRADGTEAAVETSSGPMLSGDRITGTVTVWHDITRQRNTEESLRKALQEAEEGKRVLDALMEYVPEGITIADAPDFRIRMVSRSGQETLGGPHADMTAEAVAGQWKVYEPDGVTPMAADDLPLVRAIRDGVTVRDREIVQVNAEGRRLTLSCNAAPILSGSGEILGGVVAWRDITGRKKAQEELESAHDRLESLVYRRTEELNNTVEALRAERKRFNDVLEQLPAYLALLTPDYHVSFANRFFRERFGESHGRRCYEYLFERTEPCEVCETYTVMKTGLPTEWEWTGPDAHNYHIFNLPFADIDGTTLIMEMGIDITGQKRMEEELRVASRYARNLIETSLDPLVTISPEGKITDVNRATEAVTGVTRKELVGSRFQDYFTEPEKANEGYQKVISDGFVIDYPLSIRHVSGAVTHVLYNASLYKNEAGRIQGVFAAARDITAKKTAEAELEKYRAHLEELVNQRTGELEKANRTLQEEIARREKTAKDLARSNKDLEQFAYVASHDLQEPLRAISGFVGLLKQRLGVSLDAGNAEYMNFVIDGVSRMQSLINGLLEYSRIDIRGKTPEPTDANAALERALLNLQAGIKDSGAKITSGGLPTVSIDSMQLVQLLQNLIGNAIKFRGSAPPEIDISAGRLYDDWLFAVRDNGIGIEDKYLQRIFLIFQRLHTRDRYPGTGIGLALCKKIVERHGGKIWAESGPGGGSTFYFTIPCEGGACS